MNKTRLLYAMCAGTIALTSPVSNAALVTYTDQAAFMDCSNRECPLG